MIDDDPRPLVRATPARHLPVKWDVHDFQYVEFAEFKLPEDRVVWAHRLDHDAASWDEVPEIELDLAAKQKLIAH